MSSDTSTLPPLTDSHRKLLFLVLKHAKTLDIDFDAVAVEGGWKDAASARNSRNRAKKIMMTRFDNKQRDDATPKAGKKRKGSAEGEKASNSVKNGKKSKKEMVNEVDHDEGVVKQEPEEEE